MSEKLAKANPAGWLSLDAKNFIVTVNGLPNKDELPQNIETHLIVEFYSR